SVSTFNSFLFFFHLFARPPLRSSLFPYTTLFRSLKIDVQTSSGPFGFYTEFSRHLNIIRGRNSAGKSTIVHAILYAIGMEELLRSEEHTSELQSRENLVCRLLLEKKKNK